MTVEQLGPYRIESELAKVPEEYHEDMRTNLRVNREILAAWAAELGDGGNDPDLAGTRGG